MTSSTEPTPCTRPWCEEHHAVSERGGEVEIVGHRHARKALLSHFGGEQLEDHDRVPRIEVSRGLVEQKHLGPLGKSARQSHQFLLPARQLRDRAPGQIGDSGLLHRLFDRLDVIGARQLKASLMGASSHHHDLLDPKAKCDLAGLRHDRQPAGHISRRKRREVVSEEPRGACLRPKRARQHPKQRGFARPVGADDNDELARMQREVEIPEDRLSRQGSGTASRPGR